MEMLIKIQLVLDRFKQVQSGLGQWFNQSIKNMSEDTALSDYKLAFAIFNLNNFPLLYMIILLISDLITMY